MKKILTILSLAAIAQCSNVRAVELVEVCEVIKENVASKDVYIVQSGNTKEVSDVLMTACDKFYDECVTNANVTTDIAKQNLQVVITEFTKVNDGHPINFVETANVLFEAGMLLLDQSKVNLNSLPAELRAFFDFGVFVGQSTEEWTLTTEITVDRLKETIKTSGIDVAELVRKSLEDPLRAFGSFFVPLSTLEARHKTRGNKSNADEAEIIRQANHDAGVYAWAESQQYGNVIENMVSMAREVGRQVLEFGYTGQKMVPPLTPKEVVGHLEEEEKVYLLTKAAMWYLYENPNATAGDAVEAGVKRVKGENSMEIFGTTEEARKKDAVACLEMVGRELFQVGRFAEHVPMIVKTNKSIKLIAVGGHAKTTYMPAYNQILPENRKRVGTNIPIKRELLWQFDVGAYDGKYSLCCGIFSTQFNSRQDLIKWVNNNYKEDGGIFAPSKFVELVGNDPLVQPTIFEGTILNQLSKQYEDIVKKQDEVATQATIAKNKKDAIGAKSYMWIINLLQRPGYCFDPGYGTGEVSNSIFPIETTVGSNNRARPLYWWHNGGFHYNARVARGSYAEISKYLRYWKK